MPRIGSLAKADESEDQGDILRDTTCFLRKHRGASWRVVVSCDPDYVNWIIYNSSIELDEDLFEALKDALEEMED